MSKRLVLVDPQDVGGSISGLYGKGLDPESIFTTEQLESLPEYKRKEILDLKDEDAVMLIGGDAFKYLRQFYHYGIRNENYADCSKLYRLSITDGFSVFPYVKCLYDLPTKDEIREFLDPNFTNHVDFNYQQKVLKTYEECESFLTWLDQLPKDEYIGFDYEASGMALDKWFELSGASLCTQLYGGFLALTDLRKNSSPEQYRKILKHLGDFLQSRQDHIVVFNMQYEYQVSHRMLGVNLYDLIDAQVINVVDGYHKDKKYSLKWTAQRILGVRTWDQHFDKLSDLLEDMYFEIQGKTKKDQVKVYKVDQSNFHQSKEFKEIISMFPQYEEEFKQLILEYWGQPFMNIPSDILGYYCNLDSFYTLQMWLKKKPEYSTECWNIYMDNARFGSKLMSGGLYINEPFRLYYKNQSEKMMAWGITYCAMARCMIRIKVRESSEKTLHKYPKFIKLLLERDLLKSEKILEVDVVKNILSKYIDTMDAYELGLDEGSLLMDLGEEFAVKFSELLRESMVEIKFKGKIDETVVRKKKLLSTLGSKVSEWIGLDKIDVTSKKHKELEEYLYYQKAYKELEHISKNQLTDIKNIPDNVRVFGENMSIKDYSDFISNNYFKCKSPIENDTIINEMTEIYKVETSYLAALLDSINQLPGENKFYKNLQINSPQEGFEDFMRDWESWCTDQNNLGKYPVKVYIEALRYWKTTNPCDEDSIKNVWTDFSGYNIQKQLWSCGVNTIDFYESPFNESDLNNNFSFIQKFTLNYLLYKKYSKVLSTYIEGMFKANNKWVIEGRDHIPLREADPNEPGAVERCFIKYEINTKASTRSSSAIHTAISHSDLKDCITTPPEWDSEGNMIFGESPQLLSYYDISSAEVKGAGYASGDPNLIDCFDRGEDIYIKTAKLYYHDFDKKSKADQKKARKQFKTVFLGVLYGLGVKSLAQRLNCTEDEAKNIIEGLYEAYPKLREYITSQQQYPFQHEGRVNTFFGNRLVPIEWEMYKKAGNLKEQRNLIAKIQRLGVNYPIQGSLSSAMASFFFNTYRQSIKENWEYPLEPYICVHDSSTSAFPVSKIFEIKKFYDTYFTDYGATIGPKIKLFFDLLEGNSYEASCEVKQRAPEIIEFTSSARTLLPMYDKIMRCKDFVVEAKIIQKDQEGNTIELPLVREMLVPNYIESPMERFIDQEGTCVVLDKSEYTIKFIKIQ